jgi:cyanate permease
VARDSDTPAHRAIAVVAWIFVVIGLVGIILLPQYLFAWVVFIGFGIAGMARAYIEWRKAGKG